MQCLQQFPMVLFTMGRVLWRKRWSFGAAVVVSMVFYHVLVLLLLSKGLTEPPTYVKVYNVPQSIVTIWRSTPALIDILHLVDQEAVFEFGHTVHVFRLGKPVAQWSYVATIHALGDTGIIFLLLGAYLILLLAYHEYAQRRQLAACPALGRSVLSALALALLGTGTGAVCCGAISLGLVATLFGATAAMTMHIASYQGPLLLLGYAVLSGSVLYQGYRLHQMRHSDAAQRAQEAGWVQQVAPAGLSVQNFTSVQEAYTLQSVGVCTPTATPAE